MPRFRVLSHAIFSFLLFLAVAGAITGCDGIRNAWYNKALTRALHENGLIVTDSIKDRVEAMRRVDLSGCPDDFTSAYQQYIHAWEELASAEADREKLQGQWGEVVKDGVLALLPGSNETPVADYRKKLKDAENSVDEANRGIQTRRQIFEAVIQKYGLQP